MSSELQPGSLFANDFRIVRPLDEGGMGSVYVAEQLSTGNLRALKLMLPSLVSDARLRERFLLESKVGSRIQSDHVVQVIAAGVDGRQNVPWLAMELLSGEELDARVSRDGPLAPAVALEVTRQLCHALSAAHAVGVVHRDLKPKNLFLCKPRIAGAAFQLKVLDFGIAKVVAEAISTGTAGMGTPLWMAPEQTELTSHVGPETDLWALGLIVYWMLTGKSYWLGAETGATNVQVILRELVMDPIVPASQRAAQEGVGHLVPPGFDAWLSRCLQRNRTARFTRADVAMAELEPVLDRHARTRPGPTAIQDDFTSRPTWADGVAPGATRDGAAPSIVVRPPVMAQAYAPPSAAMPSPSAAMPSPAAFTSPPIVPPLPPPPQRAVRRTNVGLLVGVGLVVAALVALVVVLVVGRDKPKISRDRGDDDPPASASAPSPPRPTKEAECAKLFAILKDAPTDMASAGFAVEKYAASMERTADRVDALRVGAKDVAGPATDYGRALREQASAARVLFGSENEPSEDALSRALLANTKVSTAYGQLVDACDWHAAPPIPTAPTLLPGEDGENAPRPTTPTPKGCACDPRDPLCACPQ